MAGELNEAANEQIGVERRGARVLVIDGDPAAHELLQRLLEGNGLEVVLAETAIAGLRRLFEARPDLVLLDIGVPGADGRGVVVRRIRDLTDVPVIVTGRDDEETAVTLLRAGADDYVRKPFGLAELAARMDAVLRRTLRGRDKATSYADGVVDIHFPSLEVKINGKPTDLTALELRMLMTFVEHPNQVLSAAQLLERVWGDASLPRDRVKLYVAYLRDKFRHAGTESPIETVRGFGYRYRPPSA